MVSKDAINLPPLYARVVAACPAAEATCPISADGTCCTLRVVNGRWVAGDATDVAPQTAASLIGWHWLGMLPPHHALTRDDGGRYFVLGCGDDCRVKEIVEGPTALAALSAWLVAGAGA